MLGAQLQRAARAQPGRAFDLVGHSQGGGVIALFLATVYRGHEAEYPPIDHVVTFASPLKGTPAASSGERLAANPIGRALMEGLGAADLPIPDPLATSIRQLAEVAYGNNPVVCDRNIGSKPGRTCAIDDQPATQDQFVTAPRQSGWLSHDIHSSAPPTCCRPNPTTATRVAAIERAADRTCQSPL